jgi:hypothetical protein
MKRASCSCGGLTAICEGAPVRVSMCHCLSCQQRTGSIFGVQARFPADRVTIEGPYREFQRTGDEGGRVTFRFCPTCGSTLCWQIDADPSLVAIAVGAFADPTFPPPSYSVYEARKHAWAPMPAEVEHID